MKPIILSVMFLCISISMMDCSCSGCGSATKADFDTEELIIEQLGQIGITERYVEITRRLALVRFEAPVLDGKIIDLMMNTLFFVYDNNKKSDIIRVEAYHDRSPIVRLEVSGDDMKKFKKKKNSQEEFSKTLIFQDIRPLKRMLTDDLIEYHTEILSMDEDSENISVTARYTSYDGEKFLPNFFLTLARILDRVPWLKEIQLKYVYGKNDSISFYINSNDLIGMFNKEISQEDFVQKIDIEAKGNFFAKAFPAHYTRELHLITTDSGFAYGATSEYGSGETMDEISDEKFGPKNLFDGSTATCWGEGASGDGTGEAVYVTVADSQKVLSLVNGNAQSANVYKAKNRVKKLKITPLIGYVSKKDSKVTYNAVICGAPVFITVEDTMKKQKFPLKFAGSGNVQNIRSKAMQSFKKTKTDISDDDVSYIMKVEIMDIYKGKDNDTCISEIAFTQ
jgi:hypothetical protein